MSQKEEIVDQYIYLDKNQTTMAKIIQTQSDKLQVQLLTPLNKFQINDHSPFYRELVLVNQTKQVKNKEYPKLNVQNLQNYLNNFYNFENQTLDHLKVEESNAYLLRFVLKGKKDLICLQSNQNLCFYCHHNQKEGDIYKCHCGKLYHLNCYQINKKCFDCDDNLFLDLKQNKSNQEFDFSDINYQQYKRQNDSDTKPIKLGSQKEVLKQRNSISKDNTELNQFYEMFKKKYKQKNVNQNLIIRNKIRNQYFKIFLKVAFQNLGNPQKIGKLSDLKLNDLADYIEKLSLGIDKIILNKFGDQISKNSPYSQYSKQLIYSLKNHNKQIVENVLSKKMTLEKLCNLSKQELANQNLLQKIEREKKELWESRKIEQEDIAKPINFKESGDKNANIEIVPVALESEAKDNKAKLDIIQDNIQSQKSIDQQKQNESQNKDAKTQDLLDFKENLLNKMQEYISKEYFDNIKMKIDEIYTLPS